MAMMGNDFKDHKYARSLARIFDRKPMHCTLYVTDRCNLDCGYCHEYDNGKPHPDGRDLIARIDKARHLGVARIAFVGGEPLLHPDILDLIKYAEKQGIATSMSTNGFLLSDQMISGLVDSGLRALQISVDRVTSSKVSKKALERVSDKILAVSATKIKVHLTSVMCGDTLAESHAVLDFGLSHDILTELRVMHPNPDQVFQTDQADLKRMRDLIFTQIRLKRAGRKIHATTNLLNFQKHVLGLGDFRWTCLAGYKIFFVSADGYFWLCSHKKTEKPFLEITTADLKGNDQAKSCQKNCGIYCAVNNSRVVTDPIKFLSGEVGPKFRQVLNSLKIVG